MVLLLEFNALKNWKHMEKSDVEKGHDPVRIADTRSLTVARYVQVSTMEYHNDSGGGGFGHEQFFSS